jgi:transcriptional regulator with XRE-family HTH domain
VTAVDEIPGSPGNNILDVHRRAISDYRIALGLELRSRRTNAKYSFEKLASRSKIPAETLRSYEKGASLPQLTRLADIGNVYGVTLIDILTSTAEYIYRASGERAPNGTSVDRTTFYAVVLYCGVTPAQLRLMEFHPSHPETISEDLFRE